MVSKIGIPESAILSVRAGSVKRQAPSTSDKPFRFAKGETKDAVVKVDILGCLGTGYAVLKPFEDRYKVALSDGMACEIDVKHLGDNIPVKTSGGKETDKSSFNEQSAQSYLEEHGVLQFIQGIIQVLVRERPDDPYKYMSRHMQNGYDADTKPPAAGAAQQAPEKPQKSQATLLAVHEQARATLPKCLQEQHKNKLGQVLTSTSISRSPPGAPPGSVPLEASPSEGQAAKCAPPRSQGEEPSSVTQLDPGTRELRVMTKNLLVQGFHDGRLENTLLGIRARDASVAPAAAGTGGGPTAEAAAVAASTTNEGSG